VGPGIAGDRRAFVRVLDNVDHKAEIDDIGVRLGRVWTVGRIPPRAGESISGEVIDITTMPAAVVED
jgi:hypothetical protein